VLLGYDHDENGNLIINENEAKTVRLIFFMYLYGYSCEHIAEELERLGRKTKKGNTQWTASSVLGVLRNERHCGDVLAHKTFTPNYRNHKSKKNKGERTQYRWKYDHEAIITRSDFLAVQQLIDNTKYKNTDVLPKLKVVTEGALSGFVVINPRWSGFKAEDYICISEGALSKSENAADEIISQRGDFDFRGYEIVRSQLFNTLDKISVTFTVERFKFSVGALRKLDNCRNVEMLICPYMKLLALRKCDSGQKNSVLWNSIDNRGKCIPRSVGGKAFLSTLYELADWNSAYKYRARGIKLCKGGECVLIFDLCEPEVFIPRSMLDEETANNITSSVGRGRYIFAMPKNQTESFGENFYRYLRSVEELEKYETLIVNEKPIAFTELEKIDVTPVEKIGESITKLIEDIGEEYCNDR
ncbi:MAG: recombinase family protein, partial [Oscillospiraceae bacterium]|nr:recombinase family protein [Oscillospiraceae bacterium]